LNKSIFIKKIYKNTINRRVAKKKKRKKGNTYFMTFLPNGLIISLSMLALWISLNDPVAIGFGPMAVDISR
jgi:hypothetical protein